MKKQPPLRKPLVLTVTAEEAVVLMSLILREKAHPLPLGGAERRIRSGILRRLQKKLWSPEARR